ncbi:hypothetical protein C8J30_1248 [Rhodobacter viridis]|uniref:CAAX prenyl protease 2/Lysostaphin resistance protein A-like domain-containing protein n=1 Tax=Rhodobacter viridis TaxID=1054202 RepID=A0A318TPJ8_9RHOB|nr:CPBP family intramembrane glutamic endopeptidase [Rhodobacter viridis]PYF06726.1 hypothetical protein C8J30_1248 [Rhodobacter viridis]
MILSPISALAVYLVWQAITIGLMWAGKSGAEIDLFDLVGHGISPALGAASLFLVAVLWRFGWARAVGLRHWPAQSSLKIVWPWLLFVALLLLAALAKGLPPGPVLAFLALNTALVGFSEEVMLRGIVAQGVYTRLGFWPAVLGSTALFGAMHLLNVSLTGDMMGAVAQATAACLSGLFLMAVRLRTGSLWTGIVLHGLWDFATFLVAYGAAPAPGEAAPSAWMATGLAAPFALIAVFLLRPKGRAGMRGFD